MSVTVRVERFLRHYRSTDACCRSKFVRLFRKASAAPRGGTLGIKDPYLRVQELRLRLSDLGFVERAFDELNQLSENGELFERELANWTLAVWHANQRSPEGAAAALASLEKGIDAISTPEQRRRAVVLRAECLAMLGETELARAELAEALATMPHADLHLAAANLDTVPDRSPFPYQPRS